MIRPHNQFATWAFGSAGGSPFSPRYNEHVFSFVPQALLEVFWIHVGITSDQPGIPGISRLLHHCFHQRFVSRRPSCRMPKIHGKDPHASSDNHPRLGDFALNVTVPSSLSTTAPKLLSIATKTPPDVCLQSTMPALSSVILAASAANIHPCFDSRLSCSSFLILCSITHKDVECAMVPFRVLPLRTPRRAIQQCTPISAILASRLHVFPVLVPENSSCSAPLSLTMSFSNRIPSNLSPFILDVVRSSIGHSKAWHNQQCEKGPSSLSHQIPLFLTSLFPLHLPFIFSSSPRLRMSHLVRSMHHVHQRPILPPVVFPFIFRIYSLRFFLCLVFSTFPHLSTDKKFRQGSLTRSARKDVQVALPPATEDSARSPPAFVLLKASPRADTKL